MNATILNRTEAGRPFGEAGREAGRVSMQRRLEALQALFAEGCEVPPRQVNAIAAPGAAAVTSLVMPAWLPGRHYGVKVVNIAPGNAARGLPGLHASYLLHDAATGVPLALIDGDHPTEPSQGALDAAADRALISGEQQIGVVARFDVGIGRGGPAQFSVDQRW